MVKATMNLNEEYRGIELKFENKPSADILAQVKEQGFRWHRAKQLWFAKDTADRRSFVCKTFGLELRKEEKSPVVSANNPAAPENTSKPERVSEKAPNTFAANYDKIGDAAILKDASSSLMQYMEAFCEKEQLYFHRYYGGDSITLSDVSNAQKTGKACDRWTIYPSLDGDRDVTLVSKLQNAGADSIGALAELCRSGKQIEGVSISHYDDKAVDIFSPFVEVKPLKELPEKWTKRNFAQALMSGQLYRGEVAYRYTDDYAYDAAYGFGEGHGLDMPSFAKREIGDWGTCTSCHNLSDSPDKNGAYTVSYSEHSNSGKTLYFDVNCDIAEGKRRAEQHEAAIKNYNNMMEASCIEVSLQEINPAKIYHVVELHMNGNTGVYGTKESNLQGDVLRNRLDPECHVMNVLSVEEMEIQPDLFYSVSNFYDRMPDQDCNDKRIIPMGNWEHIVSGKALLELTAEGKYFPHIAPPQGDLSPNFDRLLNTLTKFADGTIRYMVGVDKTDYRASINALIAEYQRAGGTVRADLLPKKEMSKPVSFDSLVKSAQDRQASQQISSTRASNTLDFDRS